LQRGGVAHVAGIRGNGGGRKRCGQRSESFIAAREQSELRALGGVLARERGAQAAARAGQEDV